MTRTELQKYVDNYIANGGAIRKFPPYHSTYRFIFNPWFLSKPIEEIIKDAKGGNLNVEI